MNILEQDFAIVRKNQVSKSNNVGQIRSAEELIVPSKAGDKFVFQELYRSHVGRVYTKCLRFNGQPSMAEEATLVR